MYLNIFFSFQLFCLTWIWLEISGWEDCGGGCCCLTTFKSCNFWLHCSQSFVLIILFDGRKESYSGLVASVAQTQKTSQEFKRWGKPERICYANKTFFNKDFEKFNFLLLILRSSLDKFCEKFLRTDKTSYQSFNSYHNVPNGQSSPEFWMFLTHFFLPSHKMTLTQVLWQVAELDYQFLNVLVVKLNKNQQYSNDRKWYTEMKEV